jgi:ATP-dependent DNA helicase RecG
MENKIFDSPIEYLKGVGPQRAELLKKELQIYSVKDLLFQYPFRYIDKTQFHNIIDLGPDSGDVQLRGTVRRVENFGEGRKKRLVARFRDESGALDLVWFQGAQWMERTLVVGQAYVIFGRVNEFNGQYNIPHPEIEVVSDENTTKAQTFAPVYPSTEKLNQRGFDAKARRRVMQDLFEKITEKDIPENLTDEIITKFQFPSRYQAIRQIHFPKTEEELESARRRLKFEELFFLQLRLLQSKRKRKDTIRGIVFGAIGTHFNRFFHEFIPFELTGAQKRVLKEIRRDLGIGIQMNRLVQGDVGSGKTIVGFMAMLMAIDNGYQACLMAPTEILAQQHYASIGAFGEQLGLNVAFLSGGIKGKKREAILKSLAEGEIHILLGTHALIEDPVVFKNLGLAIIDEQHRFGVEQRAKLWHKNKPYPPHVLVMTATPIPRTLAMTLYGDLDVSVIDELPPGRKEIKTVKRTENNRISVFGFMKEQISLGRQIYVVYPLIEESETLDLKNLMEGFDALSRDFPMPEYQISIVHGRMKAAEKDFEMQRFIKNETQIMVATTVIEVGVNVPNASVMVIENAERFGLSQLHQLRGRVGRGAEQSFCVLMSSFKLSADGRERLNTMCNTNNGFDIAEADLKLRGPGNIEGTQQSGSLNFSIADLARDGKILAAAREVATIIVDEDSSLSLPKHERLLTYTQTLAKSMKVWSKIS